MIVSFQKDKEMLLVLHLPGDHGIVFRFPCPVFGAGVCKISTKGVHLHPLLLCREALFHAASKAYSLNDRQGGARGCIVKRV